MYSLKVNRIEQSFYELYKLKIISSFKNKSLKTATETICVNNTSTVLFQK